MTGATDYTRLLSKLIPQADGEDVLRLRSGVVMAVNSDGTADVAISGVTLEDVPVLGSNLALVVGQTAQVLTYRGALLVLGQVGGAASSAVTRPSAFATFGTPSLTDNTITALTPSAVSVNDGAMWVSGSTFTVPAGQTGLYEAGIVLRYATQVTALGQRQARINVNGAEHMVFPMPAVDRFNNFNIIASGVTRIPLTAGNTVTFLGYQNSGGALALTGNSCAWLERVR